MTTAYEVPQESAALIPVDDVAMLNRVAGQFAIIKADAEGLIIHDDESHKKATFDISVLRKTRKKVADARLARTREIDETKRLTALPYKLLEEMAKPVEDILAPKITVYQDELEAIAKAKIEAERKAEIERLEKIKAEELKRAELAEKERLAAEAEKTPAPEVESSDEAIEVEAPGVDNTDLHLADAAATEERIADLKAGAMPKSVSKVTKRTIAGAASRVRTWDYAVMDLPQVPLEYLAAVDEDGHLISGHKAVKSAITGTDGLRNIPGLRIFEKRTIAVR